MLEKSAIYLRIVIFARAFFFVQSLFLDLCLYTFLSFCDLRFVLLFKSPFLRILELHYCVLSTFPNKSWLLRPVVVVFSLLFSIYL